MNTLNKILIVSTIIAGSFLGIVLYNYGIQQQHQQQQFFVPSHATLPDGTMVTGDFYQIKIVEFNFIKNKSMTWEESTGICYFLEDRSYDFSFTNQSIFPRECLVDFDLNLNDIENNSGKWKKVCLVYINQNESKWNSDFINGYASKFKPYSFFITDDNKSWGDWITDWDGTKLIHIRGVTEISSDNLPIWIVRGTAVNVGNDSLDYPRIIVNFYNKSGTWLASEVYEEENIPSGDTWTFRVMYDKEFRNEVEYISFDVDSNK